MRHTYSKRKFSIMLTALAVMGTTVIGSAAMQNKSLAAQENSVVTPTEMQPSEKQAIDKPPEVDLKAVSYILGISIAKSMREQKFPLQTDDFVSGFRAASTGQALKYTNDEMNKVMMAYQKQQTKKFYAEQMRKREEALKSQPKNVSQQAIEVSESTFSSLVLDSDKPVLVSFGAQWCGACRKIDPSIQELAKELKGQAVVTQVDVDASPRLAKHFGIQALPTLLVFKNGKLVDKVVGVATKSELLAKLISKQTDS